MKNLKGLMFGKLEVLFRTRNIADGVAWRCYCSCGGRLTVSSKKLLAGNVNSCGKCSSTYLYIITLVETGDCVYEPGYKLEKFAKIGISKVPHSRFNTFGKYKVIRINYLNILSNALEVEQHLHNKLSNYRYRPNAYFDGYTECFSPDVIDIAISELEKFS